MKHLLFLLLSFVVASQTSFAAEDGLEEVNRARAARRLPPYLRDATLTQAAAACADFRASRRIEGHTSNDFGFLPPGAQAASIGCGALEPSWGWGTCCTYDNYRYAGAAVTYGADGKRYMQLYVSNSPNGSAAVAQAAPAAAAPAATQWVRMASGWAHYQGNAQVGYLSDQRLYSRYNADGTFTPVQTMK